MLPPFISSLFKKIVVKAGIVSEKTTYRPSWHKIKEGVLKGREIYIDPRDGYWQSDMINGSFEKYFLNYIAKLDLMGKTIYDVGAHIGYSSMLFAQLVGKNGTIFAFEPNPFNIERMETIISKNTDLKNRIKIMPYALSEGMGETIFNFSKQVDNGTSSGSYINGSHTPFHEKDYEKVGFKKMKVKTVPLEQLVEESKLKEPFLLKIDVEGAEHFVLNGAKKLFQLTRPIALIEVHSIYNMFHTYNFFVELNYSIELLNVSKTDGRCFIATYPKK